MGVISYPIPAYSNLPIEPQYYQPSRFVISAITLGPTTLITTTEPHNYVVSQLVRLLIPQAFGSYQLNEQVGYVTSVPADDQVVVAINSVGANAFRTSTFTTQPQILAVGDIGNGALNGSGLFNTGTFVPGSFINISPQ